MGSTITAEVSSKLEKTQVIWFGSVGPDGKPHLTPVWFVWLEGKLYIAIDPKSVKSRNLKQNPWVVMALEDGVHPVICEGKAISDPKLLTEAVSAAFLSKYEWDLGKEAQYNQLVQITPEKWLAW